MKGQQHTSTPLSLSFLLKFLRGATELEYGGISHQGAEAWEC